MRARAAIPGAIVPIVLLLLLAACGEPAAPARATPSAAGASATVFDGPSAPHPRERMTAATLFAGPIDERAGRLEKLLLLEGSLADAKEGSFLAREMAAASVGLDCIDASGVAHETVNLPAWSMISIGEPAAPYRVVVTPRRDCLRGPGSSALQLTVFLETLRLVTIARASAEGAGARVALDFVLPGEGREIDLAGLPRREGLIVGHLVLGPLEPVDPKARILVARTDRPAAVVFQALASVLADFSGSPAAWGEVGLDESLPPVPEEVRVRLGQEILPRVELCGASGPEGLELRRPAGADERARLARAPALHEALGGENDRLATISGRDHPLALAAARALAMALLRIEAAYEGR